MNLKTKILTKVSLNGNSSRGNISKKFAYYENTVPSVKTQKKNV